MLLPVYHTFILSHFRDIKRHEKLKPSRHLRLGQQQETGNYASSSYEPNQPESQRCVEASLFARIPIDSNAYHAQNERIMYEYSNDSYMAFPIRKNLEQLEMSITDQFGRPFYNLRCNSFAEILKLRCRPENFAVFETRNHIFLICF